MSASYNVLKYTVVYNVFGTSNCTAIPNHFVICSSKMVWFSIMHCNYTVLITIRPPSSGNSKKQVDLPPLHITKGTRHPFSQWSGHENKLFR